MKNGPRLEALSDKVRMGIPIDFGEAIEVIAYQDAKRAKSSLRKLATLIAPFFRNPIRYTVYVLGKLKEEE